MIIYIICSVLFWIAAVVLSFVNGMSYCKVQPKYPTTPGTSTHKPIPEAVLKNAGFIATADILPEGFEMFPCPDGSVQFEYPDKGENFDIFEIYETEFIHSYRGGYTGFYAWEDFLRYIGTLDLKFCYPKHVHTKRIEGAI